MILALAIILQTTLLISGINCLDNNHNNFNENYKYNDPLFLTPYIENGKIEEAKKLSNVNLTKYYNDEKLESYSGFITINKTCNSNTFFWFFPSKVNYIKSPIIIWLHGGPIFMDNNDRHFYFGGLGISSLSGLFNEIGPIYIDNNEKIKTNNQSWTEFASILFIDNPVGTGFSFTLDKDECQAKNSDDIKNDLYNFIIQFYKLFPEIKDNDLHIHGRAYGGKFATGLAYSIYENNKKSYDNTTNKINLKRLIIGNGFIDPINMLGFSKNLYHLGIIDSKRRDQLNIIENNTYNLISNKQWEEASMLYKDLMNNISKSTAFLNTNNYIKLNENYIYDHYQTFITKKEIRYKIHVGDLKFNSFSEEEYLIDDMLKSVTPWIEELLDHHKIIIYNGELDILFSSSQIINYIEKLNWCIKNDYYNATIKYIRTGNNKMYPSDYLGYIKEVKNLAVINILRAGRMVLADRPAAGRYIFY